MPDIHLQSSEGATARIAPELGFCCLSWCVGGVEHVRLPVPEDVFRSDAKTGGIPLLYPFANRLRNDPFNDHPWVKRDDNDLPIHGCLLRFSDWTNLEIERDRAAVTLDWGAHPELIKLFPYPHKLRVEYVLEDRSIRVTTQVFADGGCDVPASFGWHPYLCLPDVEDTVLSLETPKLEHVQLDDQCLPVRDDSQNLVVTGASDLDGSLMDRTFDDLYRRADSGTVFALAGAGKTVRLTAGAPWHFIQVYHPPGADFVAIEPMMAPAAALSDRRDLPIVKSGEVLDATFELSVQ